MQAVVGFGSTVQLSARESQAVDSDPVLYPYTPRQTPAIVSTALFFAVFLLHFVLLLHKRLWVVIPLAIGTLAEALSHAFRTLNAFPGATGSGTRWYLSHQILAIGAPPLYMATLVALLFRAVKASPCPFISPRGRGCFVFLFMFFDLLAFFLQAVGITLCLLQSSSLEHAAKLAVAVGSALQVASYVLFIGLSVRLETSGTVLVHSAKKVDRTLAFVVASATLITVRSAFRLVIYEQNASSDLATKELFYYLLQALPMLLASAVLLLLPKKFVPGYRSASPSAARHILVSSPVPGPVHVHFASTPDANALNEKRDSSTGSDTEESDESHRPHHERGMPSIQMTLPPLRRNTPDFPRFATFPPPDSSDGHGRPDEAHTDLTSESSHQPGTSQSSDLSSWVREALRAPVPDPPTDSEKERIVFPRPVIKDGEDSAVGSDSASVYSSQMQTWKSRQVSPVGAPKPKLDGVTRINPALRLKPTLKVTHPTPASSVVSSSHPTRSQWI